MSSTGLGVSAGRTSKRSGSASGSNPRGRDIVVPDGDEIDFKGATPEEMGAAFHLHLNERYGEQLDRATYLQGTWLARRLRSTPGYREIMSDMGTYRSRFGRRVAPLIETSRQGELRHQSMESVPGVIRFASDHFREYQDPHAKDPFIPRSYDEGHMGLSQDLDEFLSDMNKNFGTLLRDDWSAAKRQALVRSYGKKMTEPLQVPEDPRQDLGYPKYYE